MLGDEMLVDEAERRFGKFVHMSFMDKILWAKYLFKLGINGKAIEYDVRVGEGVVLPPTALPIEIAYARALTTKRIDAVWRTANGTRLYECKPRAGLGAIGQLIGYRTLYAVTFPTETVIETWLITDRLQPDMILPLQAANIGFYEVDK